MQARALRERWNTLGIEAAGASPAEFKALFAAEIKKWAAITKAARISAE
jgi:tripartite-type tricarboxylate transporter receptor subunit TctC